ncbi:MAG: hypothetical protein KIT56_02960 [Gammaproteobacteria bacterium]|nr:hypothetical protein [Gammaproteobacteria bacterium]MCW5582836.1 hypothetical protein [Gammaproteobacteria bacterium]
MADSRIKKDDSIIQMIKNKNLVGLFEYIKNLSDIDFIKLFNKLDCDDYRFVMPSLFEFLKNSWDLNLAKAIKTYFAEDYNEFVNIPRNILDTIIGYSEKLQKIKDNDYKKMCINLINQFIFGTGNINYHGGMLTLAAINSTKNHIIPTIFDLTNETFKYFEIIAKAPRPLRERFVCFKNHWVCGEIEIDGAGKISIVIIDSLGDHKLIHDPNYSGSTSATILFQVKKFFSSAEIFLIDEKRQNTPQGCSVFALDDVVHLYSVEKYLSAKYSGSLFDFLRKNQIGTIKRNGMNIHISSLPLYLLRTMASTNLLTILQNSEDKDIPINKKGDTAKSLVNQPIRSNFFEHKSYQGQSRLQNNRIEYKLTRIADRNFRFLLGNDFDQVIFAMNKHSLVGFKNRIEESLKQKGVKFQAKHSY